LSGSDAKTLDLNIPVAKTLPDITTDQVNNFGIKQLIGRGTSTFYHSIPGRVHNVALASSRLNGTLVKPGETFSFNQALGDVSAFTGYQQAYIISEGKTILGDGGGVCQVSTTLFRALLNAGLPIMERQAHAYRVSYYEQGFPPGLDATVFSPSPDLKFVNDTPAYILIEAKADTKNFSLVFELYGTDDGRIATISKPLITNIIAPPEDKYQDDPTLPTGIVKQIDYKAWGAKVTFNYRVVRDGVDLINKTFISNYKPWQAIYLKGTGASI
jgi:vancomycin resistance protein YoaR